MQPDPLHVKARDNLLKVLNHALEEEVVLSVKLREFLNHITGPNSHSLYRLFWDQCRQLDRWLGELSERSRGIGVVARAAAGELGRAAKEAMGARAVLPPRNMMGELLTQHQAIANRIRGDLVSCTSDPVTTELLKRLVEFHETAAWMLRMVLDGPEVPRPCD